MPKAKSDGKSKFNALHFQSPEVAREYLEALRWGSDRVCPHCGTVNKSFATKKPGVYRCRIKECRKDFSVTTKSVMESSHIKLNVWLQAFFLMASSKKGISSHQLHRALGITYKSARFLTHRIREAMRVGGLMPPMGGNGGVVEADETYIGRLEGQPAKGGSHTKNIVLTLVERGGYQHCAEKHLHRYLSEFDFRYSNRVALGVHDGERADLAIKGAAGKRLTYRQAN